MSVRLLALSAILLTQAGDIPASAQSGARANETVSLPVGGSKTIVFTENPSTGYKWQLDTKRSSILATVGVMDAGYQPGRSGLIGAPGSQRWQIEARASGTARIVFVYSRPWEHQAPARSQTVTVNVTRRQ